MFNIELTSFHDTVAEQKAEREQNDKLLIISTPQERLTVLLLALIFAITGAWLLLGEIDKSLTVRGFIVEPGNTTNTESKYIELFVWIKKDDLPQIVADSPVEVEYNPSPGERASFDGELVFISPALSMAEHHPEVTKLTDGNLYRVGISYRDDFKISLNKTAEYLVKFHIGTATPTKLFLDR